MLKLGILDQSPIIAGGNAVQAFQQTIELAKLGDQLGYSRYWVSEHHDAPGLAGSSPEVLVSAIAAHTSQIRVGSGGVLLPHYSPYKVAENFHVLEALYPNRIDLGIGRAPGGMPLATRALRYGRPADYDERFTVALHDLAVFLNNDLPDEHPYTGLRATPLIDTNPEVWLLGSSGYSADRAAELGASFSFAHFINGEGGHEAVRRYYETFKPGPFGSVPRANVCVIVVCADTDEEAEQLVKPIDLRILLLEKGESRQGVLSPEDADQYPYTDWDRVRIRENRKRMIIGGTASVKSQLETFSQSYGVNEVIAVTMTHDFQSRMHSYELLAKLFLQ